MSQSLRLKPLKRQNTKHLRRSKNLHKMYPLLKTLYPGLGLKKQKYRQQLLQLLESVSTSSAVFLPSERESQKPGVAATVALLHTNVAVTKTFSNKLLLSVDLCVCVVVLVCLQLYLYFCTFVYTVVQI